MPVEFVDDGEDFTVIKIIIFTLPVWVHVQLKYCSMVEPVANSTDFINSFVISIRTTAVDC